MGFEEQAQQLIDSIDPVRLAAILSVLPEDHVLVVAARSGLAVGDRWRAMRDAGKAISAAADWRRIADSHVPFETLQERRAVIGPLAG